MTVEINARHKNISEGFREYAKQRAENLGEAFPMVESVRVVMDFQNTLCAAEVIAQRKDEKFIGTALKKYPRDSYFLADKVPGYGPENFTKLSEIISEQLRRCRVE